MPGEVFLRSERVTLRTVEPEDAELLQRARNDPDLREGLLFRSPSTRGEVEAFIEESVEGDDESQNLLICVSDEPIGAVDLFDIHRESATLAYWLLPDHHGDGYATEAVALVIDHAFDTLGLNHLVAWTIGYNGASQALLGRLGFSHEGTYREHVFRKGEHHDTEHYGILADEWTGSESILDGGSPD
ncbi:GNAT family N-acetyltransferase [Halococcus saccharolyticus]|uniref:GCN5-like N-acetyltransferase n=1 Tax=Halococcus saccharolyticus DSM 5350 TaxID=1227455 RepID=M0MKF0_9EURY|nr:GNAT family protein [Halococcus saccharolyticus]EMA45858.1 GCN5-like N-acetyltransferase [Halococcus saccharolyticus DSM 5350]